MDINLKKYQKVEITATIGKKLQETVDFVNKVKKIYSDSLFLIFKDTRRFRNTCDRNKNKLKYKNI